METQKGKTQAASQATDGTEQVRGNQTTRGDFLKWGTVALSGMYVGPKITTFAVENSLGHAGSPAPNHPSTPPTPSFNNQLPPTGGAAPSGGGADAAGVPTWLPAAGAGAAALGLYARHQARTSHPVEAGSGSEEAE